MGFSFAVLLRLLPMYTTTEYLGQYLSESARRSACCLRLGDTGATRAIVQARAAEGCLRSSNPRPARFAGEAVIAIAGAAPWIALPGSVFGVSESFAPYWG